MSLSPRSNAEWIEVMRGRRARSTAAVRELERYLNGMLVRTVGSRLGRGDVEELVQDTLARIVRDLDRFRGDSAFTTWAAGVAVRVALTELRRRAARERRSEAFEALVEESREPAGPRGQDPDAVAARVDLIGTLKRSIDDCLTERQRIAILAELRGFSTVEIAARLGTNQNALYKLTHDARKKLRSALMKAGFGQETLRELASEDAPR